MEVLQFLDRDQNIEAPLHVSRTPKTIAVVPWAKSTPEHIKYRISNELSFITKFIT